MELIVALGMEMGNWVENNERKNFVMLQDEKISLTNEQYDLWLLAQQAGFTSETAAEFLKMDEATIKRQLLVMQKLGVIVFWTADILSQLDHFTFTPRGNAGSLKEEGQQLLYGYVHAKPVEVDAFGHALWMHSNGLIPLNKVVNAVAIRLQITLSEALENSYYWIPFLIRHGLAVLNLKLRKRNQ